MRVDEHRSTLPSICPRTILQLEYLDGASKLLKLQCYAVLATVPDRQPDADTGEDITGLLLGWNG